MFKGQCKDGPWDGRLLSHSADNFTPKPLLSLITGAVTQHDGSYKWDKKAKVWKWKDAK